MGRWHWQATRYVYILTDKKLARKVTWQITLKKAQSPVPNDDAGLITLRKLVAAYTDWTRFKSMKRWDDEIGKTSRVYNCHIYKTSKQVYLTNHSTERALTWSRRWAWSCSTIWICGSYTDWTRCTGRRNGNDLGWGLFVVWVGCCEGRVFFFFWWP